VAAGDRAGGTFWPVMSRYYLSLGAPPSMSESLVTDALHRADRLDLAHLGAIQRSTLATISQFRDPSPTVLATWRELFSLLDDDSKYVHGDALFYSLAEGEHGELAVGLHIAEDLGLRLSGRPHDPCVAAGLNAVLAHLRRLRRDLNGAEA